MNYFTSFWQIVIFLSIVFIVLRQVFVVKFTGNGRVLRSFAVLILVALPMGWFQSSMGEMSQLDNIMFGISFVAISLFTMKDVAAGKRDIEM